MRHTALTLLVLLLINILPVSAQQNADSVYLFAEQPPVFPGGTEKMLTFIATNTYYPQTAADSNIEGKVMIKMIVDKSGKIRNAAVYKSIHPSLDSEALAMVGRMPAWQPAQQGSKAVNAWYYLPVSFSITKSKSEEILENAEVFPEFPGGLAALQNFIYSRLKYPDDAISRHVAGQVLVRFVIDETGAITSPSIVKSIFPSLDNEALRVVNLMPKWHPGIQQGKPVKIYMTIPVTFRFIDRPRPLRYTEENGGNMIHSTRGGAIIYPQ